MKPVESAAAPLPHRRTHAAALAAIAQALALALGGAATATASPADDGAQALAEAFRPPQAQPAAEGAAGTAGLRLVLTGRPRPLAALDGRLVHVGDSVNGLRVLRIDPQGVTLAAPDGATQRLPLHPPQPQARRSPPPPAPRHAAKQEEERP